jgi:hypothetical protein
MKLRLSPVERCNIECVCWNNVWSQKRDAKATVIDENYVIRMFTFSILHWLGLGRFNRCEVDGRRV